MFTSVFFSFVAKYFSESCAPGADPESNLCKLCKGAEGIRGIENKCKANTAERYYGYAGAFRYDSHQPTYKKIANGPTTTTYWLHILTKGLINLKTALTKKYFKKGKKRVSSYAKKVTSFNC